MEDAAKLIEAITNLVQVLLDAFGIWGTLLLILVTTIICFIWRVYQNRRRDRKADLLIKEKDRTIQRMRDENKLLRIVELKRLGWTDQDIQTYVT